MTSSQLLLPQLEEFNPTNGKMSFRRISNILLAIVWQQMRYHIISILSQLKVSGTQEVTEQSMIEWANRKVEVAGKKTRMANFKDQSLKDSKFFIDLVDAIKPGSVDYSLVTDGRTGTENESRD